MPTADLHEPLSEAMLDMLERDFKAGLGCWSGDGLALVAEVRQLRSLLAGEEKPCAKCGGCGQVADTDDQEPWTWWLKLPLESSAAVLIGLVKPIPCPVCVGEPHERREGEGGR